MLSGASFIPQTIKKAVILCHGYGADGEDLMGLVPYLKEHLPNTAFFAPDAPIDLEYGYAWFPLEDYHPGQPVDVAYLIELTKRAQKPATDLRTFIQDIQQKYHLNSSDITLVGFSQGGLVVAYTALTQTEPFGHVIALSAIPIIWTDELAAQFHPKHIPFFITHGSADPVVPVAAADLNIAELRKAGQDPALFISDGIGHAIDQPTLDHIIKFIQGNNH